MNRNRELTYEEFTVPTRHGILRYNNFYFYFCDDIDELRRVSPEFRRFQEEHPELEAALTREVSEACKRYLHSKRGDVESLHELFLPHLPALYEAYRFMRQYVELDEDIL